MDNKLTLQFRIVPQRNDPDKMQWQSRVEENGKTVLYVPDRRSSSDPSDEKPEWICSLGNVVFRNESGTFMIVSVHLIEPVIHVLSPRAQRRAKNRGAKRAQTAARLERERLEAQRAAEERRHRTALQPKKAKKGDKKQSKNDRKQLAKAS